MAKEHDSWIAGIGVDIETFLPGVESAASGGDAGAAAATPSPDSGTPAASAAAADAGATADYSGISWVSRYPTSTSLSDLDSSFQTGVSDFKKALEAAGASVSIAATLRPPERAHLMHYAWAIAREGLDPASAPTKVAKNGVEIPITWVHVDAAGKADLKASKAGAEAMMSGKPDYDMSAQAVLDSRHIEGLAIDMTITWSGTIKIKDKSGAEVSVAFNADVDKNTDLHKVGASYGVIKLVSTSKPDKPHWSSDGH